MPSDLLTELGLGVGDVLTIEVVNGSIVLRPKPNDPTIR
nr:AbrB/MazE/SpoVT family DNA-binding domain-containing protein [Pseudomonas chlororaphis]